MHIRPMIYVPYAVLICGLLAACGGASPTPLAGDVETRVAATIEAMTARTAPGIPTPTLPATAIPVQVLPQGSFVPYAAEPCEQMRSSFEQAIGAPVTVETAAFSDHLTGGTGTACQIHASGNGATYGMSGPFNTLVALLPSLGWSEDINYDAGGPTGMALGYRKGSALGLLEVSWKPSPDANCPSNQPIGACELAPEQKLFDVTFDLAQVVVYVPLPADQCAAWLTALQPAVPVPLVLETVNFSDLKGDVGTACQLRGAGNGLNFDNFANTADALAGVLASQGWTEGTGADGPTGTVRAFTSGNQAALITVGWQPSADANCPADQPISACNLAPEQKLYTTTVAFAQK